MPLQPDEASSAEICALAQVLVEGDSSEVKLLAAHDVARAQLEMARVRQTRAAFLADLDLDDLQGWKRLAALDRYERLAYTKRRKAAKYL